MTPSKDPDPPAALPISGGPLLNFYWAQMILWNPVTGQDWVFNTVEHWFQAMKAMYLDERKTDQTRLEAFVEIATASTAVQAKAAGRALPIHVPLWNRAAFGHMVQGHIAKFSQNPLLGKKLDQTGDALLIEARNDPLWGWGPPPDHKGKNLCGRSLMIVRSIAREQRR